MLNEPDTRSDPKGARKGLCSNSPCRDGSYSTSMILQLNSSLKMANQPWLRFHGLCTFLSALSFEQTWYL